MRKGTVFLSDLQYPYCSTLKRVEKEREFLPLPARKVYFLKPKRSRWQWSCDTHNVE